MSQKFLCDYISTSYQSTLENNISRGLYTSNKYVQKYFYGSVEGIMNYFGLVHRRARLQIDIGHHIVETTKEKWLEVD